MPSTSKAQQRFMGAVHSAQQGAEPISGKVAKAASSMSKSSVEDFASTKHKGLPNKKQDLKEIYGVGDPINFYVVIEDENTSGESSAIVLDHNPVSFAEDWGRGQFEFDQILAFFLDEKKAQAFADKHNRDTMLEMNRIEEKKSTTVNKLRSSIDKLEKQRKQHLEAIKADPKNSSQHREAIAQITTKIDDLVTKMERVETSKKPIQDQVDPKKKLNESAQSSIDNHPWIKNSFRTLVENLQEIQKHPKYTVKNIMYYINDFISTVKQVKKMTKDSVNEEKNVDNYTGSIIYRDKTIDYDVHFDWDLGMNGNWVFSKIEHNGEDVREYDDLGISDGDVKEIKRMIIKKIQKETGRRYY